MNNEQVKRLKFPEAYSTPHLGCTGSKTPSSFQECSGRNYLCLSRWFYMWFQSYAQKGTFCIVWQSSRLGFYWSTFCKTKTLCHLVANKEFSHFISIISLKANRLHRFETTFRCYVWILMWWGSLIKAKMGSDCRSLGWAAICRPNNIS